MNDLMTKSFLNYAELKKQDLKDSNANLDVEIVKLSQAEEENLGEFFEEVGMIKAEMEAITYLLSSLQELHEETKLVCESRVLGSLRGQLNSGIVTVLRKARIIKVRLEEMDRSNIGNRRLSANYREGTPIDRTRIAVTNGLRIKLRELMMDFQCLRDRIVSEHREGIKRMYFNATGEEPSEDTIEEMVLGEREFDNFPKKVEMGLENNRERRDAVKEIQKSLMELHQIFLDMAVLVESQGEKMDDIELNVVQAGDYVGDGANFLDSANDLHKREKQIPLVSVLLVILMLVFFILFLAGLF